MMQDFVDKGIVAGLLGVCKGNLLPHSNGLAIIFNHRDQG